MINEPKICKCCGAPLHDYKCDYCGVEYEKPKDYIPHLQPYIIERLTPHDVETLACKSEIALECMRNTNEKDIVEYLKHNMAIALSEKLIDYMDVETWIRAVLLIQFLELLYALFGKKSVYFDIK